MFLSALTLGEVNLEASSTTCQTLIEPTLMGSLAQEDLVRTSNLYASSQDGEDPLRAYVEVLGVPNLILFDLTRALTLLEAKVTDPRTEYPVWVQTPRTLILKFNRMSSLRGREAEELQVLSRALVRAFRERPPRAPISFEA